MRLTAIAVACAIVVATPAGTSTPTWEAVIAAPDEPGEPFVIEGTLVSGTGQPLRDVSMYIYSANAAAVYAVYRPGEPTIAGTLRTNVLGRFRVRTVLPGPAEGVPHVHFEVADTDTNYRQIPLNLCRRRGAGSDSAFAQLPYLLDRPDTTNWAYVDRDAAGTFRCTWRISFEDMYKVPGKPRWTNPHR